VILKTVFVGLCLLFVTQAAAAATAERAAHGNTQGKAAKAQRQSASALSLEQRLARAQRMARAYRGRIRYYRSHRWLLQSARYRPTARVALRHAARRLARATRTIEEIRRELSRREARRLAKAPPKRAICHVFGRTYCRQALAVSWCESRHSTTAQNGQYLGLFQMGSYERRLFGHGRTAHVQAVAAHRYFVHSGRDWSPWSCKPAYAM
jgi:hypothetical protein